MPIQRITKKMVTELLIFVLRRVNDILITLGLEETQFSPEIAQKRNPRLINKSIKKSLLLSEYERLESYERKLNKYKDNQELRIEKLNNLEIQEQIQNQKYEEKRQNIINAIQQEADDMADFIEQIETAIEAEKPKYLIFEVKRIDNLSLVRDLIIEHKIKGRYTIILLVNGEEAERVEYDIPEGNAQQIRKWWNFEEYYFDWAEDSANAIFRLYDGDKMELKFVPAKEVEEPAQNIKQSFLESKNLNHCFFTPILKWASYKQINAVSERQQKYYMNVIKKVNKLIVKYENGIPQDDLQNIADKLRYNFIISTPFQNDFIKVKSTAEPIRGFRYINCRMNHLEGLKKNIEFNRTTNRVPMSKNEYIYELEQGDEDDYNDYLRDFRTKNAKRMEYKTVEIDELLDNNTLEPNKVNKEELAEIIKELDKNDVFYTYKKSRNHITSINTNSAKYSINCDFYKAVHEFEEKTQLNKYKINAKKNKEFSEFILEANKFNVCFDYQPGELQKYEFEPHLVNHVDQSKAYTQSQECRFYERHRFPLSLTDFRTLEGIDTELAQDHPGFYRINNIVSPKTALRKHLNDDTTDIVLEFLGVKNKIAHLDKLNIYQNNQVYFSAELEFLTELCYSFKLVEGAYSVNTMDITFTEEMKKKDENKNSYFAKYVGLCKCANTIDKTYMKGNYEYFQHLKNQGHYVRYFENDFGYVYSNRDTVTHLGQFSGAVTAYQRLNLFEQLFKIDVSKVIRIITDGIYYTGPKVPEVKTFHHKNKIVTGGTPCISYVSNLIENPKILATAKYRKHYRTELNNGAGGNGKTYFNLSDKGFTDLIYIAPSHKLRRAKQLEFKERGIDAEVLAVALNTENRFERTLKKVYPVMIFDEITQYTEAQKYKIFETYPQSKIIFCGDLGMDNTIYQLPCVKLDKEKDKDITIEGFDNIITFNTNYRFKCDTLKNVIHRIRQRMKGKNIKYKNSLHQKSLELMKPRWYYMEEIDEEIDSINDVILTSTKDLQTFWRKKLTNRFKQKKWRANKTANGYCNGDIIISKEKPKGCNAKEEYAFTIHAFQGETIRRPHKLFIDCRNMFEAQSLYTAISRIQYFDQLYLIVPPPPKEEKDLEPELAKCIAEADKIEKYKEKVKYIRKTYGAKMYKKYKEYKKTVTDRKKFEPKNDDNNNDFDHDFGNDDMFFTVEDMQDDIKQNDYDDQYEYDFGDNGPDMMTAEECGIDINQLLGNNNEPNFDEQYEHDFEPEPDNYDYEYDFNDAGPDMMTTKTVFV